MAPVATLLAVILTVRSLLVSTAPAQDQRHGIM